MLTFLRTKMGHQETIEDYPLTHKDIIWIDLCEPSQNEELAVEELLGFGIPTRAEMSEIEPSSRLYFEHQALFMTATMLAQSNSPEPILAPVTFILTKKRLVTIRYIEPQAFKLFTTHLQKGEKTCHDATGIFIELLDATIDRLADILELVGHRLDDYSKTIFRTYVSPKHDYWHLMQELGLTGDLNTKARESLVTFNRLMAFFIPTMNNKPDQNGESRLVALQKDITSLSDHAHFLSGKVNFLLDATLGMVNIEQNNIIKIFSVAAVIFLPPTLIASIYGMNFHFIPELNWEYGYAFSIGLILFAAWVPYKYFKYRKWL